MSYIKQIEPEQAAGKLRQLYDEILQRRGGIANLYKLLSLDTDLAQANRDMYWASMLTDKGLSGLEREVVAVAVAVSNECDYCLRHHLGALREAGGSEDLVERLTAGEEPEDQPERVVRLVYYARKLTLLPGAVGKQDIEDLREVGLKDLEIMQSAQIIGYYNYANRLANGLGVEIEAECSESGI
ncbi:peroxidase-related enzyme [bacterium]|nr:peroxidase-related enzyme [bacterium]MBU1920946.1 peroxidase-related enzyme [bacterium]